MYFTRSTNIKKILHDVSIDGACTPKMYQGHKKAITFFFHNCFLNPSQIYEKDTLDQIYSVLWIRSTDLAQIYLSKLEQPLILQRPQSPCPQLLLL